MFDALEAGKLRVLLCVCLAIGQFTPLRHIWRFLNLIGDIRARRRATSVFENETVVGGAYIQYSCAGGGYAERGTT